ncbi:hypothetical protein A6B35_25215 [Mesorhizobium amorphae CCNWGS0123]|nr:hypothetical protein A6B35_25215 [Mesorhizobium amorphae CCNWGS0123]
MQWKPSKRYSCRSADQPDVQQKLLIFERRLSAFCFQWPQINQMASDYRKTGVRVQEKPK